MVHPPSPLVKFLVIFAAGAGSPRPRWRRGSASLFGNATDRLRPLRLRLSHHLPPRQSQVRRRDRLPARFTEGAMKARLLPESPLRGHLTGKQDALSLAVGRRHFPAGSEGHRSLFGGYPSRADAGAGARFPPSQGTPRALPRRNFVNTPCHHHAERRRTKRAPDGETLLAVSALGLLPYTTPAAGNACRWLAPCTNKELIRCH